MVWPHLENCTVLLTILQKFISQLEKWRRGWPRWLRRWSPCRRRKVWKDWGFSSKKKWLKGAMREVYKFFAWGGEKMGPLSLSHTTGSQGHPVKFLGAAWPLYEIEHWMRWTIDWIQPSTSYVVCLGWRENVHNAEWDGGWKMINGKSLTRWPAGPFPSYKSITNLQPGQVSPGFCFEFVTWRPIIYLIKSLFS